MRFEQTQRSRQTLDIAPFWRLAMVVLCLSAAIYIPLLASEPRLVTADAGGASLVVEISSPRSITASSVAMPNVAPNRSAMAQLAE